MRVEVCYRSAQVEAEQVRADIVATRGEATVLQGDITESGMVERLIEQTVTETGRVDLLINNAADLIERRLVADIDDELFDRHSARNVRPAFAACRVAVR